MVMLNPEDLLQRVMLIAKSTKGFEVVSWKSTIMGGGSWLGNNLERLGYAYCWRGAFSLCI